MTMTIELPSQRLSEPDVESVPLTPVAERPYTAHAVRVACAEFVPLMLKNVDYLETMQRRVDESNGRDRRAAIAVAQMSRILRNGIWNATSHGVIHVAYAPQLDRNFEAGAASVYALPLAATEDLRPQAFVKPKH